MKEHYCICGHLVSGDIERNEHILSHFKQKQCLSCDSQLIFVAGKWYQPHNDPNCIVIKEEPEIDCGIGFIPSDGNGANSIIGADNVIIQEAERSNEQNIHDNDVQQEVFANHLKTHSNVGLLRSDENADAQIAVDSDIKNEVSEQEEECLTEELEHNEEIIVEPCLTYTKHQRIEAESLYNCDNCPKKYKTKSTLVRHKKYCTYKSLECKEIQKLSVTRVINAPTQAPKLRLKAVDNPSQSSSSSQLAEDYTAIICYVCHGRFQSPTKFANHLKSHPNVKYKCTFVGCNDKFDSTDSLICHLTNHMQIECKICKKTYVNLENFVHKCNIEVFICDYCNEKFSKKSYLRRHMLVHLERKPYSCNTCKKCFRTSAALREHRYIHTVKKPNVCNIDDCGRVFVHRSGLDKHRNRAHSIRKEFPCTKCSKVLYHKKTLQEHLHRHETTPWKFESGPDKIACPHCSVIILKTSMQDHINRKHGVIEIVEKPFVCYVCQEAFRYLKLFITHLQAHPNIEYKCCMDECDERFDSDILLHRHLTNHLLVKCEVCHKTYTHHHKCVPPEAAMRIICDLCGKRFKKKHVFKQHMDIHLDIRPFPCDLCDKAFRRSTALTRHRNSHTGTKPLKCNFENCDRAFIQHTDLHRHRYKAHGIFKNKFTCTICNQVFPENALLRKHMLNHEV